MEIAADHYLVPLKVISLMKKMAKKAGEELKKRDPETKECSIAFKEIPQLTSNELAEDERMARRLNIASFNHYVLGKQKKKRNFITHSTGLYLISQEELIRNEKWKKDTISLQEILYMTQEHMQTNTSHILNKVSTLEQVANHPETEY